MMVLLKHNFFTPSGRFKRSIGGVPTYVPDEYRSVLPSTAKVVETAREPNIVEVENTTLDLRAVDIDRVSGEIEDDVRQKAEDFRLSLEEEKAALNDAAIVSITKVSRDTNRKGRR